MAHLSVQLYEYNVWANNQIFNRLKELPQDVYRQEVQSVFSSLSNVLTHVYLSDLGWIEVFSGESMNHALELAEQRKEQTEAKEIGEMEVMFSELADRYKSFLNQTKNINKPLVIEHPSGDLMKTSVSDLVPHVVNHGTYHRGNITAMLRQMGYTSVATDYGLYLYLKTKGM
ncbi:MULTISPECIES: DinB family protein [Bacillus]|uniref:Damage-inducible protein DinB n=2 Tax=Bacillus TaxID=1386 RepID=A0A0M4FQ34_9BACI|nr:MULTISPECIES: DinB family protein [Bacillus]ALC81248.1 damage-inducible protein DinB [Bacillus gobiensis]MBP1080247.1 putative damage-inducible protein DinB [Bacillus capparidis]MED1094114.1 DinB family protein [Bacillus capparidis]